MRFKSSASCFPVSVSFFQIASPYGFTSEPGRVRMVPTSYFDSGCI